MAVQAGTAEVEVGVTLTGEARRVKALEAAVGWAQSFRNGAPGAAVVVEAAVIFEEYLEKGRS